MCFKEMRPMCVSSPTMQTWISAQTPHTSCRQGGGGLMIRARVSQPDSCSLDHTGSPNPVIPNTAAESPRETEMPPPMGEKTPERFVSSYQSNSGIVDMRNFELEEVCGLSGISSWLRCKG
uniref:Uncharacterized protein n=1 Tax=Nothobranchius kadleci TaxID=1051664 RepID=A0A1A8EFJ1_NOTKA